MAAVVWTARASADLDAIVTYQARTAPGYAALLARRLLTVTERLAPFPESGRIVPEMGDASFREVLYRTYRVVYLWLPDDDRVEILTVFHASRAFGDEA